MKIARSEFRWRVLSDERIIHDCLESLAFQSGYRVAIVSQELGITEQHFRRIFHRDVGIPVKEWMKRERMVIARRMLISELQTLEVSDALGFAHANSFRREFAEMYEMTVSEFLKLWKARRKRAAGISA